LENAIWALANDLEVVTARLSAHKFVKNLQNIPKRHAVLFGHDQAIDNIIDIFCIKINCNYTVIVMK